MELSLGANVPSVAPFWQTDQTWAGIVNNTGGGDRMLVTWPMLVSDGAEPTQVGMTGNMATLRLGGRGTRFTPLEPPGVALVRSGKPLGHRNGTVEVATAEFSGKRAVYRIEAASEK